MPVKYGLIGASGRMGKEIESLMNEMQKNCAQALGVLGNRNPTYSEFRKWLEIAGEYYFKINKKF